MDEPTSFAAGHRPCFLCRRERALAYFGALDPTQTLRAPDVDRTLDRERRDGHAKKTHALKIDDLPDGAIFSDSGSAFAVKGDTVLEWSFGGYDPPVPRPRRKIVDVLTPPTTLHVLRAGYAPEWHPSANCAATID